MGVYLDSPLSFDKQVSETCKACCFLIRALPHIQACLTTEAFKTIAAAIYGSRLDFFTSLLAGTSLKWSYGVFRHPRGRKIAIIPKLLWIKIWNFLTFIIWLSSEKWCHYYFVGCPLWRHHGHQRGTGRRRNYNFVTVHWIKQVIHFFPIVKIFDLNPIYVFEVREFNGETFRTLPLPLVLENPVRTGCTGTSRLPIFLPGGILGFYLHLCCRGRGIRWWHF